MITICLFGLLNSLGLCDFLRLIIDLEFLVVRSIFFEITYLVLQFLLHLLDSQKAVTLYPMGFRRDNRIFSKEWIQRDPFEGYLTFLFNLLSKNFIGLWSIFCFLFIHWSCKIWSSWVPPYEGLTFLCFLLMVFCGTMVTIFFTLKWEFCDVNVKPFQRKKDGTWSIRLSSVVVPILSIISFGVVFCGVILGIFWAVSGFGIRIGSIPFFGVWPQVWLFLLGLIFVGANLNRLSPLKETHWGPITLKSRKYPTKSPTTISVSYTHLTLPTICSV